MSDPTPEALQRFLEDVATRNPHESEFHQAVEEVATAVWPIRAERPQDRRARVLERLIEPERTVIFAVPWVDDQGRVHVERGYRVQLSSLLGPYKGGLRFHPTVTLSVLKFLAFEQAFKNALTGLPLGAGKGGATFDPKGRSDDEIMRFCQSFMTELWRHIGPTVDIPAGDIGVGSREIGFLFGQYRRLRGGFDGALTGKGVGWGGSELRVEATGYGLIAFVQAMLCAHDLALVGKRVAISGSGNVAQFAAERAIYEGAMVVALSDSDGFVHIEGGLTQEMLAFVKELKNGRRGRLTELAEAFEGVTSSKGAPWSIPVDVALPCATQNELDGSAARALIDNGCKAVAEGANMPCTPQAVSAFRASKVLFAPGKAANAGGVATSGLEMRQNAQHSHWSRERVQQALDEVMQGIHDQCAEHGGDGPTIDYVRGANVAAYLRLANAMIAQGVV